MTGIQGVLNTMPWWAWIAVIVLVGVIVRLLRKQAV